MNFPSNISDKQLSRSLKKQLPKDAGLLDKLKIAYRPYIFPYVWLLSRIQKNDKIADIGCGSGMFLRLSSELIKISSAGGIEIDEHLVKNAQALLSNNPVSSRIEKFDGKNIPEFIADYNKVFLSDVFHHIPKGEQQDFIKNLYSKIKPGTIFYFKDIDRSSPLVFFNKLHDLLLGGGMGNEISLKKAQGMLKESGFKIYEVLSGRKCWYPHYMIVCKK